ncbi:MAG: autotransporter domain-containing protein [Legionella sp.]|nr:autotransporter domain-containing protein [Legionella sp.]
MDIRKNKRPFPENIKRFALKATASAIIALNAESVEAVSCPIFITDTSLAGVVCDFDATSSVTVENGGEVGGINMAAYTPGPPSFIAINAGGLVNNTTGIGINISASSLSNGISNDGTITTSSSGIVIANTSIVSGGISNGGAISSTSGTSILISNGSTVSGGISNSGTIQASNVFVGITLTNNSIINGDITNSGLIAAETGNGILLRSNSIINGNISNSGTISSVANTGISVLNSSAIQGNISNNGLITGGNLGISIHNASTVGGNIVNNGTISGGQDGISIFSATTISGSISNNGTISGGQDGLSIASSATISGGISNSGIIQGATNAITIDSSSNVSNIDILGQSARIIGAVEATNTTVNITSGAIFTSEGTYNVNNFNIASNALFNMANTITAQTVNNAGTLAITNTLQTIVGDFTQQVGGLFQTGVTSTSNYGQLLVTGAVDLSQNGDIYVQVSSTALLRSGDVFSNVISGNTLTSPASGFNISDNSYIWRFIPTLNNTNNGLNLTVGINPDAYNVCQGTYCQGAATAILGQVAAGNSTFSRYATLSTASALRDAASQATPELTNENIQVTQLITRAVMDVAPMWGTLRGRSSGDALLYQPGKIWVKPYGASMVQNERNTVPGFNATAYGAVIGKDIQLSNDWLLGGGFAAGGDNMHGKAVLSGQSINSQAYQGMLYGAKRFPNHVYFAGQGLVGLGSNDTTRSIPLYTSTAQGSFDNWFTNIRAETGWSTYALTPNFIFTPSVDASYLFINQKGYQEFGSPMDLLVASNNNSSLVLGAYTNGAYHLTSLHDQQDLTLTGYVGLAGDVLNGQPQVTSTFVASGSTFSTFGVQFNGVVFRGGAGVMLTNPTSPLTVELNYDLQAGNNAYSSVGAATIKYKT